MFFPHSLSITDIWTVEVISEDGDWPQDATSSGDESQRSERKETPPMENLRYCELSDSAKGVLVALLVGGVIAGFIPILSKLAESVETVSPLQILLLRCLLHLVVCAFLPCHRENRTLLCLGPRVTWQRSIIFGFIQVISVGCAYTSFIEVSAGIAATVRKGSFAISSTVMVLCIAHSHLSGYTYFGLFCTLLGLVITTLPSFIHSHNRIDMKAILGYTLACLGGTARAVGLSIFQSFTHKAKFNSSLFTFGLVGTIICGPALFFIPLIWPVRVPTWLCMSAVAILGLVIFLATNYAVTKIHPVLVCGLLQSEVVVSFVLQSVILKEAVSVSEIIGSCVIVVSVILLIVESVRHNTLPNSIETPESCQEEKAVLPPPSEGDT
ncbi:solute carrier family 35 member G3-like [Erpetoichthys calabaricus]|uniref:solute carrier family 35 member G3-like n=1 Tax=Erpetoichthys calabaricus TaxID=27687 RepID=UPI0010A0175B|nr:solute carrier family 35 member G3-like [Erpetoichthys calabaricus]